MPLRIRRSLRLAPGVKLNLSKSGVSVSVGRPGATVNFSKRGVYGTAGLPGTGISIRERLDSPTQGGHRSRHRESDAEPYYATLPAESSAEPAPAHPKPARVLALLAAWAATAGLRYIAGGSSEWVRTDDWFTWASTMYAIAVVWTLLKRR
ncbi:MAG: DUF4236 domain-containing protein [Myxococcales bacterium]|jgi:hypothetical protein